LPNQDIGKIVYYVQFLLSRLAIRHLVILVFQDQKAPKVRGRSAEENPVLT